MKKIITVSNRLPITIGKEIKRSSGGLVSALESFQETADLKWVGWVGGMPDPKQRRRLTQELAEKFGYLPVYIEEPDATDYYDGFSNSSMWPLLHYMTTYSKFEAGWFEAYKRVNALFADTILALCEPQEVVWIHDYHLMLLPLMLREKAPDLKIGFFLHTPFPSSEVFRCHPNRTALVEGLLGADLVGFHTYGYLRHFRSTVLRVLGIESEINSIAHDRHRTFLGVYPIGINAEKFSRELSSPAYRRHLEEYKAAHQGKKVVLSVERLDYTKGIPNRLDAIEKFLASSSHREKVVFIFISVPSREDVEAYQHLVEEVRSRIGQINGKYSTIKNIPLHFIHQSISFSELCALYALADVCLVTPLIDGMNLVAKEYIACQQDDSGVLVLSEFAGAAQELPNALIVNPHDIEQMVAALEEAMAMAKRESKKRMLPMRERVMSYDAAQWARLFLNDLDGLRPVIERPEGVQASSMEMLAPAIKAERIALFLDYDGTLAEIKKKPSEARPDEAIKTLFRDLEAAPGVDVYLTSGRKREDMLHWFGALPFTLIAEHGFFYRSPKSNRWQAFDDKADLSWMDTIIEIFQHYAGMTPGSFVEVKSTSVVWHYRESDPEYGTWKANQLTDELYEMLTNLPVEIHHGKKIVEVCSIQVNKGTAMDHFLSQTDYDWVVCIGDDETDESMFRLTNDTLVRVKVGDGATSADHRIGSPAQVRWLLNQFLAQRQKARSI